MAAPLRLCENRMNKEAHFSQRRKGAKAAKEKRPLLWRHLILKNHLWHTAYGLRPQPISKNPRHVFSYIASSK